MDDPRLLARDSSHGYVDHPSRAMFAEPEAILEGSQRQFSDEARRRWQVVKGEELARKASRSRCNRLKNVDMAARRPLLPSPARSWNRRLRHLRRR